MSLPVELFVVHTCWEGMTALDMVSGSGRSEKLTMWIILFLDSVPFLSHV
jgi:hypothetical protein